MSSIAARLKWARIEAGYPSARRAALVNGWALPAYKTHENGTRGIGLPTLKMYAQTFGVTASWLEFGEEAVSSLRIPVSSNIGAGAVILPFADYADGTGFDYIEIGGDHDPETIVAAKVSGESMKGEALDGYRHGDIVAGVRCDSDFDQLVGSDCIIQLISGEGYLKRLERGSKAGLWDLVSLTPGYERLKDQQIQWAAKVRWINRL